MVDRSGLSDDQVARYRQHGIVHVPGAVGDPLLFDFRTVHRSGPNRGSGRRATISWRWLGDDAVFPPVHPRGPAHQP